jgi:hypothetical protein
MPMQLPLTESSVSNSGATGCMGCAGDEDNRQMIKKTGKCVGGGVESARESAGSEGAVYLRHLFCAASALHLLCWVHRSPSVASLVH